MYSPQVDKDLDVLVHGDGRQLVGNLHLRILAEDPSDGRNVDRADFDVLHVGLLLMGPLGRCLYGRQHVPLLGWQRVVDYHPNLVAFQWSQEPRRYI